MNKFAFLCDASFILACSGKSNRESSDNPTQDSSLNHSNVNVEVSRPDSMDSIVLYENRLANVQLPFPKKEMLSDLMAAFNKFTVTKETGEQDGPDFPFYVLKDDDVEICSFAMDPDDTLQLNEIYVSHPMIKDQYGLKVGDGYQQIKKLRGTDVKISTNPYHQHVYAYFEGSNIHYEISGDVYLPDTTDFETLQLTEDQIKDWTVEFVIWRK